MAVDKKSREGRRTPRRAFVHPIGLLCHGEYRVLQGYQLSEGGMLFGSTEKIEGSKQVVASLVMPDGGCVVARGEILYDKPGEDGMTLYGAKFTSLALNQRRVIRNYVTAKTQEEAEAEADEADSWGPAKNQLPS